MKTYIIYVEFYGKKLKIEVDANSEKMAKDIIYKRVNFLKIEKKTPDDGVEFLKSIFGMK